MSEATGSVKEVKEGVVEAAKELQGGAEGGMGSL